MREQMGCNDDSGRERKKMTIMINPVLVEFN